MKIIGIIPARYEATRFPGKLMAEIEGKTVIQRAYENCLKSELHKVWVATDDQRILDHIHTIGGNAVLTEADISTGSERCRRAFQTINADANAFVNIQGDEPLVSAEDINLLIDLIKKEHVQIATLIRVESDERSIMNPNRVKVVKDADNRALYFSRSPIPYNGSNLDIDYFVHVGMYAFKKDILKKLDACNPSMLANAEKLEQLQWLENRLEIYTTETKSISIPVDTPEDLEYIVNNWDDLNK